MVKNDILQPPKAKSIIAVIVDTNEVATDDEDERRLEYVNAIKEHVLLISEQLQL